MLVYHVGQKWRENLQPIPYIRSKHVETKVKAFVSQNNIFHLLQESSSLFTRNKENMSRLNTLPMGSNTTQQSQHLDIRIW